MEYLSLPAQCFITGAFIFAGLQMTRSIAQLGRRVQQSTAALAAMKKSLPVAISGETRQAADAQRCVACASAAPHRRLAFDQLQVSFDAIMAKLDRIEAKVDALPDKATC